MNTFLCPVCRSELRRPIRDALPLAIHAKLLLTTSVLVLGVHWWKGLESASRVVFFYLPLWAFAEYLHGVRMRHSVQCEVCDFDPLLYKKDWRAARKRVEEKLSGHMATLTKELSEKAQQERQIHGRGADKSV